MEKDQDSKDRVGIIRPVQITDQIYTLLKREIVTCRLRPGDRLVEKALCEWLGVSRPSLREALNRLAQDNLVTRSPNRGYRVTELTPESFAHVCQLREVVESQVAFLAAQFATEKDVKRLRKLAPLQPSDNPEDYSSQNRSFHMAIVQSIGNPLLEEIVDSVLDKDQQPLFYDIDFELCTDPDEVNREHMDIVDCIADRDPDGARAEMLRHIGRKRLRLMKVFKARVAASAAEE